MAKKSDKIIENEKYDLFFVTKTGSILKKLGLTFSDFILQLSNFTLVDETQNIEPGFYRMEKINNVDSLRDETEIGESKRQTVSDNLTEVIDPLKNSLLDSLYGGKKND